jgi:hypothetical protein
MTILVLSALMAVSISVTADRTPAPVLPQVNSYRFARGALSSETPVYWGAADGVTGLYLARGHYRLRESSKKLGPHSLRLYYFETGNARLVGKSLILRPSRVYLSSHLSGRSDLTATLDPHHLIWVRDYRILQALPQGPRRLTVVAGTEGDTFLLMGNRLTRVMDPIMHVQG